MVSKFDTGDDKARYEFADGPHAKGHHHHLVCTSCRRIVDYTDFIKEEMDLLRKTEEGLSKKYGFKINSHVMQFYGLCQDCAR
jgi:Fur family ferric uptake transcriptional regulator